MTHVQFYLSHWKWDELLSVALLAREKSRTCNPTLIKIAGRNRIFSSLGIEAKLIKILLPLGLEHDELHFNKRPNIHYN